VLGIAGGGLGLAVRAFTDRETPREPEPQEGAAAADALRPATGEEAAAAISERWGGWLLWGEEYGRSLVSSSGEVMAEAPPGLEGFELSPARLDAGIIGFRDSYVTWSPGREEVVLPGAARWMPDGATVAVEACASGTCRLQLMYPFDGRVLRGLAETDQGRGFSPSPDGRQIVYTHSDGGLWVVDVDSGKTRRLASAEEIIASSGELQTGHPGSSVLSFPEWSPSGRYVAAIFQLDGGYYPVVLTVDGTLVGVGRFADLSAPDIEWRSGTDELYYVVGCVEGCLGEFESSLLVMGVPDWSSHEALTLARHAYPGFGAIVSGPDGRAMLLSTWDRDRFLETGEGAEGNPYRWTLLEPVSGAMEHWDVFDDRPLDWA
jgi:hypothetical protein